ncbi:MAG TPA: site-2 protease family protein [Verrucomicrobiae bacterium]|nr:site-2 protease family protein [Verrucomicrobiae bacterium]
MDTNLLVMGLVWYVVFLLSTTCHEAAHALAAKIGGDLTAYHGGQVSLDPTPHIRREPFGMVVLPILSYVVGGWMMGWASAPYDPYWAERHPKAAAWKSLAGPAANFSLAILAGILIHLGLLAGVFVYPDSLGFTHIVRAASEGVAAGAATFVSILFSLNLLLGTFNLIPIPPLDGFSGVGVLLPEELAGRLQSLRHSIGNFTFIGLLIAWKVFDPIFAPVFGVFIRILYPSQSYSL